MVGEYEISGTTITSCNREVAHEIMALCLRQHKQN